MNATIKRHFSPGRREDRSCSALRHAEFYSTSTGFPNRFRARPNDVLLSIGDILEHHAIVTPAHNEYVLAIQDAARETEPSAGQSRTLCWRGAQLNSRRMLSSLGT
jgi:hypothetical protein